MNEVAAVRWFVVIRKISESAANALPLIAVDSFLGRFAQAVDEDARRPSKIFSVVDAVDRHADFAIGGEDALRRDRTFKKDIVRIVRDLLQTERHKEVADPPAIDDRNLVHREVGVFDDRHRGGDVVFTLRFDIDLNAKIVDAVPDAVGHEPQAAEFDVVVGRNGRIFDVRPVDAVELHVAAKFDGPLIAGEIAPVADAVVDVEFFLEIGVNIGLFRSSAFLQCLKPAHNSFDLRFKRRRRHVVGLSRKLLVHHIDRRQRLRRGGVIIVIAQLSDVNCRRSRRWNDRRVFSERISPAECDQHRQRISEKSLGSSRCDASRQRLNRHRTEPAENRRKESMPTNLWFFQAAS
jgi:hypothetical protein